MGAPVVGATHSIASVPTFGKPLAKKLAATEKAGADDPIRTDDLGITSAPLCQLSYVGSVHLKPRDQGARQYPETSCDGGRPLIRATLCASLRPGSARAKAHLLLALQALSTCLTPRPSSAAISDPLDVRSARPPGRQLAADPPAHLTLQIADDNGLGRILMRRLREHLAEMHGPLGVVDGRIHTYVLSGVLVARRSLHCCDDLPGYAQLANRRRKWSPEKSRIAL